MNMAKKRRSYPKSANKKIKFYFKSEETFQDFGSYQFGKEKIHIKTIFNPFEPDMKITQPKKD